MQKHKTAKRFCISRERWTQMERARALLNEAGEYVPEDDSELCNFLLMQGIARVLSRHGE